MAPLLCLDAFSSREPDATSLENAPEVALDYRQLCREKQSVSITNFITGSVR